MVYNISSFSLSDIELQLLYKGLGFCPKEHMSDFFFKQDMYRFYRQIRLKAFFSMRPKMGNSNTLALSIKNLSLKKKE